jgi:hypothetical protein
MERDFAADSLQMQQKQQFTDSIIDCRSQEFYWTAEDCGAF